MRHPFDGVLVPNELQQAQQEMLGTAGQPTRRSFLTRTAAMAGAAAALLFGQRSQAQEAAPAESPLEEVSPSKAPTPEYTTFSLGETGYGQPGRYSRRRERLIRLVRTKSEGVLSTAVLSEEGGRFFKGL